MYKFLSISALLLFPFLEGKSQIEITLSDMPTNDNVYSKYNRIQKNTDFTGAGAGNSGADVTWDFSSITGGTTEFLFYADPATYDGGISPKFPGSNLAEVNGNTISFLNISDSRNRIQGKLLGVKDTATTVFGTPLTFIDLPLTFTKKYSGNGIYTKALTDTTQLRVLITKTDSVDGWGSITTPHATYEALRVFSTITTLYMYFPSTGSGTGSPTKTELKTSREYNWWAKGIGKEVFKIQYAGSAGDTITSLSWFTGKEAIITGNNETMEASFFAIGPNPSNGNIQLVSNLAGVKDYNVALYDLLGKEKYSGTLTETSRAYDFSNLPDGMYHLKITSPQGKWMVKKLTFKK